jgi:hypothetical protein
MKTKPTNVYKTNKLELRYSQHRTIIVLVESIITES